MFSTKRLKQARTSRHLTQKELSHLSGLTPKQISSYETGHTEPGIYNLLRLAYAMGISIDWLCERTERERM